VAYHGSVRQASYEPFRYPYRAGAQEFGDVLAEGLVGYLHTRPLRPLPSIGYWSAFLDGRAAFLARTKLRCRRAMRHHSDAEKAVTALESAQQALAKVSAGIIVEYLDAWRHDLATWRQVLTPFTRSGGIHSALRYLGLPYVTMTRPARNHALSAT
jgi:hypothetical protein